MKTIIMFFSIYLSIYRKFTMYLTIKFLFFHKCCLASICFSPRQFVQKQNMYKSLFATFFKVFFDRQANRPISGLSLSLSLSLTHTHYIYIYICTTHTYIYILPLKMDTVIRVQILDKAVLISRSGILFRKVWI